ncbi:hypothetical protein ACFPER_00715 [Agromyces aurantiacus]|uniref:FtsX-like permease family protein n=1 Tax=Agromyces aurantiacus TaxID=165814 RepID=A0ABV9R4L3_9MICO|nr:hypothetical protein [Agromyces aurantiacus]MBM7505606.1 hypothetical protein [Agromyces aurantiacus]
MADARMQSTPPRARPGLLLARSRARAGVLAGVATVALLLAAFLTATVGVLVVAPTAGARDGLAAASGADRAVRWQTRLADDAGAQADAAAGVLDRLVAVHGAPWSRSVQSSPVPAAAGGGLPVAEGADAAAPGAVLLADPEAAGRSSLVSGAWPDDPAAVAAADAASAEPAALHAGAAGATGLGEGSIVELDGLRLLVVGTFLPDDPQAPEWAGDPLVATGLDAEGVGPFLVDESALADVAAAVAVRWTAVADPSEATAESLAALRAALPAVTPALGNEPDLGGDGLIDTGRLPATLDRLLAGLGAARALAPLPLLLVGVAGIVALLRLAVLLVSARRRETTLLLARGAAPIGLARDAALEAVVVGGPSAAVGAVAGATVLAAVSPLAAAQQGSAWLVGAGVTATVTLVLAVSAWRDAGRPVVRGAGDETGRARRALAAGAVVMLAATAAISLWQFRLYGSPLVRSASGGIRVDPLAALAPVLVLLALAVGALAVTGGAARLLERWAAGRPGLVPSLPARQLARRTPLYASAILVLAFAAGGLTLAAVVDGSWRAADRAAAAAELGGDLRVDLPARDVVRGPDPLAAAEADAIAALDGVVAGPVFRGEARVGSDPVDLVAVPIPRLAEIAPGAGTPLGAGTREVLAGADRGPAIPPAATLALDVDVRPAAGAGPAAAGARADLAVWLQDRDGVALRLDAGSVEPGRRATLSTPAPDLPGLTILGVEARLAGGGGDLDVAIGGVDVGSDPLDLAGELSVSSTAPSARLSALPDGGTPVPVVVDRELAHLVDAGIGDPLEFRVQTGGATVLAEVAGIVPVVPAGDRAVLADLGAVTAAAFSSDAGVPQHDELWLAADEPAAVADALLQDRTTPITVTTRADVSSDRLVAPALTALWIGAAGAAMFALVALAALVAALAAARAGETAVLRALGTTARGQAAARRDELLVLAAVAIAVGLAIGAVVALLTAPELGRAAVPSAAAGIPPIAAATWIPLIVATAVLGAGATAIAITAGGAVRRLAASALPGTEDR